MSLRKGVRYKSCLQTARVHSRLQRHFFVQRCFFFFFFIPPFFSLGLEEDESAGVHAFVWSDNEGEAHRHGYLAASALPVTVFFFFFHPKSA